MIIKYKVIKEKFHNDDSGDYDSFGIKAVSINGSSEITVDAVSDISTSYREVQRLAEDFNKYALPVRYFHDMVERYIDSPALSE